MRAAFLAVPFLLLAGTAAAQQPERFELRGDDVTVYNLVGAVSIEAGTGTVSVDLTRTGRDAAKLKVEQGELRGGEALRVIYPDGNLVAPSLGAGSSTTLRVREDGTFGDGDWDWGDRDHPVAAAAAVTAAVGVTAAVIGSVVYAPPPNCSTVVVNGFSYMNCAGVWYQPQYAGAQVSYVVVNPPQ